MRPLTARKLAEPSPRFIRDEASKGRYDSALTRVCTTLMFEIFVRARAAGDCDDRLQERVLARDLGDRSGPASAPEHVC